MSENDQYPRQQHGTFTPVGVILVIAVSIVVALFIYGRTAGDSVPAPTPGAPGAEAPANPNQLTPAPAPAQAP
ncbi:hypothetical protein GCM10011390_40530 [Aureimonas endophytica]|uniref:Uncharacterized protein n=1 Tax=Aureimonas endophytica TaxID=2027858 RepID=A0A917E9P9_9HYPH|nr:hypothetical protein [Aureimonas endophytica]GGE17335.1 hypothetical protein GCM10011390_40530 [Aureimonas endophytica]